MACCDLETHSGNGMKCAINLQLSRFICDVHLAPLSPTYLCASYISSPYSTELPVYTKACRVPVVNNFAIVLWTAIHILQPRKTLKYAFSSSGQVTVQCDSSKAMETSGRLFVWTAKQLFQYNPQADCSSFQLLEKRFMLYGSQQYVLFWQILCHEFVSTAASQKSSSFLFL